MQKRYLLLACLLLTACGGGSSEVSCDQSYWDGVYGTCLPAGWTVIDRETMRQRGVPEETIAGFQTEEPVSGQYPTITLTRERLAQPATPSQYSDASIRSVEVLPGYELIDRRNHSIDGEDVSLHVFSLQPIQDEPRRRFYQVSTTVEENGYTVTATSPLSVDSSLEAEIQLILDRTTFEEPSEE